MALLDADFDPFKQCFIDDSDVEFYGSASSPNTTTPSEDIWRKFDDDIDFLDCFPTPPLSPSHPSSDGEDTGGGGGLGLSQPLLAGSFSEKLQRVSEYLDDVDEPAWLTQTFAFTGNDSKPATTIGNHCVLRATSPARVGATPTTLSAHKSNFLIQDCMWSAIQAEERRRQMQAERAAKAARLGGHTSVISSSTTAGDFTSPADQCVDPTSVFPYPLSETRLNLCPSTPSDSEEEIDVVTVEKKCQSSSSHSQPRTIIIKHRSKHSHSRKHNSQQPFKVMKRSSSSSKSFLSKITNSKKLAKHLSSLGKHVDLEDVKRALENTIMNAKLSEKSNSKASSSLKPKRPYARSKSSKASSRGSSRTSSASGSRASSDSEDCDRRANHNVLERRRREDLRASFFKLRDQVPELRDQERAAKIIILRKATDFVHQLHAERDALQGHANALRERQRALVRRLAELKNAGGSL